MINILYSGRSDQWDAYSTYLRPALDATGVSYNLQQTAENPAETDYIIYAPSSSLQDFTPFTNVKLVQSLWAGVEVPTANKTLTQPLARMVEVGLKLSMADYVMGHVLRHHLDTDQFSFAKHGDWNDQFEPPLAKDRTVGILGLGHLGMYSAQKLAQFGFKTCGWSRTQKTDEHVTCYSGADGLEAVMAQSDIIVLLLPNTPQTSQLINAQTLSKMRDGVFIINPGRGTVIDDIALLAALNSGKVAGATLDVFNTEPLPVDHPYWAHPNVLVTPHVASATRTDTACDVIADNIRRGEAGEPFLHLVNKAAGY